MSMFTREFWKRHQTYQIANDVVTHKSSEQDINNLGYKICDDIINIKFFNEAFPSEVKEDFISLKESTFGIGSDVDILSRRLMCNALNDIKNFLNELNSYDAENNPYISQKSEILAFFTKYAVFDVCVSGRFEKIMSLSRTLNRLKIAKNFKSIVQSAKQSFIENYVQEFFEKTIPNNMVVHYVEGTLTVLSSKCGLDVSGNLEYARVVQDSEDISRLKDELKSQEFFESFVNYFTDMNMPLSSIAESKIDGLIQLYNVRIEDAAQKLGHDFIFRNDKCDAYNRNIEHMRKLYYIQLIDSERMLSNPKMRILSMQSMIKLIALLGMDVEENGVTIVNSAVQNLEEFPTVDGILNSTKFVTNTIQKDLILNELENVKSELKSLQINDKLKYETLDLVERRIRDLSFLTEKDYKNNQKLANFPNEQIRVISKINAKTFLAIFNSSFNSAQFSEKIKDTFSSIICQEKQEEFNNKTKALFDLLNQIKISRNLYQLQLIDLEVQESNKMLKDICLFIIKCLTFIYVYERLTGQCMINDSSDIKTDIQNFVGFIKQQTDQLISLA